MPAPATAQRGPDREVRVPPLASAKTCKLNRSMQHQC